jgi:hypothetical protein
MHFRRMAALPKWMKLVLVCIVCIGIALGVALVIRSFTPSTPLTP